MKAQLLSLLAGTALIATVSIAQAGEPMPLTETQMDQVTAGQPGLTIKGPTITTFKLGGVDFSIAGGDAVFTLQ